MRGKDCGRGGLGGKNLVCSEMKQNSRKNQAADRKKTECPEVKLYDRKRESVDEKVLIGEENWAVEFPAAAEREASIRHIVAAGLPAPKQLRKAVPELVRTLGVRNLFFGVEDCVFLAVLLTVLVLAGVLVSASSDSGMLTVLLMIFSPVFYMALHILTVWKEVMTRTYELLMTCRCSLRQLTVVRMLIFGGMSLCFSTAFSGGLSLRWEDGPGLPRLLSISFASLFLFACLSLLAERKWPAPMSCLPAPGAWIVLGVVLLLLGERAETLLAGISTMAFALAACGGAVLYFSMLKCYYFVPKEGAAVYSGIL